MELKSIFCFICAFNLISGASIKVKRDTSDDQIYEAWVIHRNYHKLKLEYNSYYQIRNLSQILTFPSTIAQRTRITNYHKLSK